MNSRRLSFTVGFALVLSLVFAYGLSPLMKPSTAAPAAAENKPFKGKVVMVMLDDNHALHLEHAQVRKLEDRSFLVGKGADTDFPADWTKGQIVWTPMNRIKLIVEFESLEKMKKAWEEYQKQSPAAPPEQAGKACSP